MNIESFIEKLAAEFEEVEPDTLKPDTNFRDLDDWSSMYALIVIALIDTEYNVRIKGEDLSKIETVQELYDLVENRKN